MPRKRMGEILIEAGVITQDNLDKALQRQKGSDKRLGQILEEMDIALEEDVAKALARQFGILHVKGLGRYRFPQEVLDLCDAETALTKLIFPLKIDDKTLHLAMCNPLDIELQASFSFKTGLQVIPCVTTSAEIKAAARKNYLVEIETATEDRLWTILLVDDQEMVLSAAEAALKRAGYNIHKARNGAEGLKAAIQIRPQLIISDVVMPRMDGIEMFQALQANRGVSEIPVIALSAKAAAEEEYQLLEMGFFDFIPKPINPIRLLARVRRAMRLTQRGHVDDSPAVGA